MDRITLVLLTTWLGFAFYKGFFEDTQRFIKDTDYPHYEWKEMYTEYIKKIDLQIIIGLVGLAIVIILSVSK